MVPTGVLTLAAVIAACNSLMPMPRAASAVGSTWTRTAYFWLPKIWTWATPSTVESVGDSTYWTKASIAGERRDLALQRQQQDRGVGGVELAIARRRRHAGRELALGPGDRRFDVGSRRVDVTVERELDRDRGRPLRVGGGDGIDAGDGGELLDQRRRHRDRHDLGRGARQLRGNVDDRELGAGQRWGPSCGLITR
jgi:hypothetical protein